MHLSLSAGARRVIVADKGFAVCCLYRRRGAERGAVGARALRVATSGARGHRAARSYAFARNRPTRQQQVLRHGRELPWLLVPH